MLTSQGVLANDTLIVVSNFGLKVSANSFPLKIHVEWPSAQQVATPFNIHQGHLILTSFRNIRLMKSMKLVILSHFISWVN